MANTTSAKKAIRRQERQSVKNLARRSDFRSARKTVQKAIAAGDAKAAQAGLPVFYKAVDKAAKKNGPLHKNTAARYKSRLTLAVGKLATK